MSIAFAKEFYVIWTMTMYGSQLMVGLRNRNKATTTFQNILKFNLISFCWIWVIVFMGINVRDVVIDGQVRHKLICTMIVQSNKSISLKCLMFNIYKMYT